MEPEIPWPIALELWLGPIPGDSTALGGRGAMQTLQEPAAVAVVEHISFTMKDYSSWLGDLYW